MSLRWKLHRLGRMGASEIVYRARQAVHSKLEGAGFGLAQPTQPRGEGGRAWLADLPRRFDQQHYVAAAERILSGYFNVFAMRGAALGFPPTWNRDPKSHTTAPLAFGKTLNYRDERLVGDIKYLWEPSRHLELVTLAQAWQLTRNPRYLMACRTLLESWFDQCPYPLGVHWTSSLEHGVRLVNWAFAWHLLGGERSELFADDGGRAFKSRWLRVIYQHAHFIAGHLSRFSSANNHLLGEYMGLMVACSTWPLWPESSGWQTIAFEGFEREALLQTAADGVNREQAIWYHHEVADMMLICGLVARATGRDFSRAYWQRFESMLEFIASLMDAGGNLPMIGDSDDAVMLRLDPTPQASVYRSLLAAGAILFQRSDFKAKAQTCDAKTQWLLGDAAVEQFDALPVTHAAPRRVFADGGYYILGSDFDTAGEVRIVADAAPLGYLSIAAHGHADALAFTLSVGGLELLIDPGTYAYHTQSRWRDYFKGTSAHNTVRIDGVDQSVSGGKFMWVRHANARCQQFSSDGSTEVWQAAHDGYERLRDPVFVARRLEYQRAMSGLKVVELIRCREEHRLEQFWHFAPQCRVQLAGSVLEVTRESVGLRMQLPPTFEATVVRGSESPILGWYSARFDEKVPCDTVRVHGAVRGDVRIETTVEIFELGFDRLSPNGGSTGIASVRPEPVEGFLHP
ncbi:MAG: alginate lyase family protein [Steroidobacteraceae bacterium]